MRLKILLKEKKEITKLSKMQNRSAGSKYFLVLLMLIAIVNILDEVCANEPDLIITQALKQYVKNVIKDILYVE